MTASWWGRKLSEEKGLRLLKFSFIIHEPQVVLRYDPRPTGDENFKLLKSVRLPGIFYHLLGDTHHKKVLFYYMQLRPFLALKHVVLFPRH